MNKLGALLMVTAAGWERERVPRVAAVISNFTIVFS
jgi:hypothetical protein